MFKQPCRDYSSFPHDCLCKHTHSSFKTTWFFVFLFFGLFGHLPGLPTRRPGSVSEGLNRVKGPFPGNVTLSLSV